MAKLVIPDGTIMLARRKGVKRWRRGQLEMLPTKWHIPHAKIEGYTVCGSLFCSPEPSKLETAKLSEVKAADICLKCLGIAIAIDEEEES